MKIFAIVFSLVFLLFSTSSFAGKIVAVVNDDAVTQIELERRLEMVVRNSNLPQKKELYQRLTPQVLETLIEEKLQLQEAERLEFDVSDEDVQQGLSRLAENNGMTLTVFTERLQKRGISMATLAEQIRANIAWNKVVRGQVRPLVEITDSDIDAKIQQMQDALGKKEYFVSEIFLPVENEEEDARAKEFAKKLHEQVKAKKDAFASAAQQFSQGAGAARGGLIGWVQEGQLPETVEVALNQLPKGSISPPIRSRNGYHIVELRDRRVIRMDEDMNEFVLRNQISESMSAQRLDIQARQYLRDLREAAFIEYRG